MEYRYKLLIAVESNDHVHVHVLVSVPLNMALNEIMRRVKGRCFSKLFDGFLHIKKHHWGRYFWARGYFCVTVC